jgi:hypothetical protein
MQRVTREEIEMDALARGYRDTHGPEIPEEIFELARRLGGWTIEGTIPK